MGFAAKIGRAARLAGVVSVLLGCNGHAPAQLVDARPVAVEGYANARIHAGAERTDQYIPLLRGKRVAVVTNQTGMIGPVHLVDSLLSIGVDSKKVFAP
ncbi:MAG: hypothetical protein JST98_03390, partial [Bacteroidetes bacterium]|nr:hypothetical protein [Bacteroidota bacterium]